MLISAVVEGFSDEGVVEAILGSCDITVNGFYGRKGKSDLLKRLPNFNLAAAHMPWFVLVDLDRESCVAEARKKWLPSPAEKMCFRIAVTEAEAWLLADAEAMSEFLGIAVARIPSDPEKLPDPKATIIALARRSRRRDVRDGLVPREGSGTNVGPTYASDIREFARRQWRPRVAAQSAPSLARCLERVEGLAAILRSAEAGG